MKRKSATHTVVRPEDFFHGALDQLEALALDKSMSHLTLRDRRLIVDQAIVLFQDNYAHLPLKEAMHAVNPVQLLKLLRYRLEDMSPKTMPPEVLFHRELLSIFNKVRDLHTRYVLPEPLRWWTAFLPFRVGEYFERIEPGVTLAHPRDDLWGECESDGEGAWAPRYAVTRIMDHSGGEVDDCHAWRGKRPKDFAPGAEIVYWNGVHIVRALEVLADQFAGSNSEARRARGLAQLTLRPLAYTVPPDEKWVDIVYRPADHPPGTPEDELPRVRIYWAFKQEDAEARAEEQAEKQVGEDSTASLTEVFREVLEAEPERQMATVESGPADDQKIQDALKAALRESASLSSGRQRQALDAAAVGGGIDYETESMRLRNHRLYAPWSMRGEERRHFRLKPIGSYLHPTEGMPILVCFSLRIRSNDPSVEEHYGLIKIRTFEVPDVDAFVDAFAAMLQDPRLGRRGLIIDLRGNGGGRIPAGERLLQFLTPRRIQPERMQFVSSLLNLELCRRYPPFAGWAESIEQSVTTGEIYSRGLPLTPVADCNDYGQRYHGPTILLTDANCYSTADIFIAGFKDHGIGKILGVHRNTGAGGANNVKHSDLLRLLGNRPPYRRLPRGAEMTVALRRSMRVLDRIGTPLEDLGVIPDHYHRLTKDDLLGNGPDIYKKAIEILRGEPAHYLYGWVDAEREDVAYLCYSRHLALDQFLDGSGMGARSLKEIPKTKVVEIDGLEIELRAFDFAGFPKESALEVKATMKEGPCKGELVATLRQRFSEISQAPPSRKVERIARRLIVG